MDNETGSINSPTIYSEGFGWEYVCRHCSKTFPSGRALGGHQNAHRFEPKERKRIRHGRMPRPQATAINQQPTSSSSGNARAAVPSRAANVFLPGKAHPVRFGYGHAVSGPGIIMPGTGDSFYQNDPRLQIGPRISPFRDNDLASEQAEHSGVAPWAGRTSRSAETHADEGAALDLDLKL